MSRVSCFRSGDTTPSLPTRHCQCFKPRLIHRRHAIIEQVIADLKNGPLAHLPSVIWGQAGVVHDVHDTGGTSHHLRAGCGYLPLSNTEMAGAMRVQRLVMPGSGVRSWTLLGEDLAPVEPVERFLAFPGQALPQR